MSNQAELDALVACLGTIYEFVDTVIGEGAENWSAARILMVKDTIRFFTSLHLNLSLDVPAGTLDALIGADGAGSVDGAGGVGGAGTAAGARSSAASTPLPSAGSDTDSDGGQVAATAPPAAGFPTSNSGMQLLNMLIHTFDGDSSYTIDVFLEDVSRACKRRKISGVGKIEIAVGKLRNPALTQVRAMSLTQLTSWKDFKFQMTELFADVTDFPSLSLEISRCKQTENETVTAFSVRLFNLLLKKTRFCTYVDKDNFRKSIDAEAVANFLLGLRSPALSDVVRRASPPDFKSAIRIARLEEVASRTNHERSQPFFKSVKMAVPLEQPPRERERERERDLTPQRGRERYDSNNERGRDNRRRDYTPQRDLTPSRGDRYRQQGPQRDPSNEYINRPSYNNNDESRRDRDAPYRQDYNQNNNYRRRERSFDRSNDRFSRPRSQSNEGQRQQRNKNQQYHTPCDCNSCAPKFSPRFVFPRISCWQCGNRGHVQNRCMHEKRDAEEPTRPKNEPVIKQITNEQTQQQEADNNKAIVQYPYDANRVDKSEWR